jgi:hypothetical protein
MHKLNRFFVHFWLAVSIASLIYALFTIYTTGWENGKANLVIPPIAFMWYLFRRSMSNRMDRNLNSGKK